MIGSDLLRYNKNQLYLIWDFETESLNTLYARPWQCSFLICTLDQIIEEHDYYVRWDDLQVSRGAAALTGFNPVEYKERARDPREVLAIFEKNVRREDVILVGQNTMGYDDMIYQVWRRTLGLPRDYSYLSRSIDANALSKAYKKAIPIDRGNLRAFQYKMLNYREKGLKTSLSTMAKELGVPYNEGDLHRGNKDIVLNWRVWQKLVWSVEI